MDSFDRWYIEPIRKYIDENLHKMATSKEKFHILCNIQQYIQQLMIDCPIASEEEVKEGVLDNYGVLYSADGRKLIKANEDLTTYIIKPGTKIICDSAFCDCRLLRVVNIPESVEIIGHSAFCRCSSLNSVLIPSSVKEIGSEAFWYCSGISFVNYPSLTYIPDGLFVACDLSDFEIPKSVYVLEASCFASCNFKHIIIPRYVKKIERMAFYNCKKLETITFKTWSLESFHIEALKQCDSLRSIYVPKGTKEKFLNVMEKFDSSIKSKIVECTWESDFS